MSRCVDRERLKTHYVISELSPLRISVRYYSPNAKYSKLKYNFRYWVKKYHGHYWFTILVTKGYSKFSLAVVRLNDVFVVVDVLPNFLPFPPSENFMRSVVRAGFLKLYEMCVERNCRGIFIDPELPFDPCIHGVVDLLGEFKSKSEV